MRNIKVKLEKSSTRVSGPNNLKDDASKTLYRVRLDCEASLELEFSEKDPGAVEDKAYCLVEKFLDQHMKHFDGPEFKEWHFRGVLDGPEGCRITIGLCSGNFGVAEVESLKSV